MCEEVVSVTGRDVGGWGGRCDGGGARGARFSERISGTDEFLLIQSELEVWSSLCLCGCFLTCPVPVPVWDSAAAMVEDTCRQRKAPDKPGFFA